MKPMKPNRRESEGRATLLMEIAASGDALPLASDLLRNASLVAWPKASANAPPPPMRIAPPLDGRGLSHAVLSTVNDLDRLKLSSLDEISTLLPGEVPAGRSGRYFDLQHWLRSSFLLLKAAQCRLGARGQAHGDLMSRYLRKPGTFHNPDGYDAQQHDSYRDNRRYLNGTLFNQDTAAAFTALALPPDLLGRSRRAQYAFMRRTLPGVARETFAPHFDALFPAEFFTLFFDFGEHDDEQIRKTLGKLAPYLSDAEFRTQTPRTLLEMFDHTEGFLDPVWEDAAISPR